MVMAIDLAGVPEFLEEMMDDPAFQEQFQQGFTQGSEGEGGQEGLDEIMAELDDMQFGFTDTDVDVAGNRIHGLEFTIEHPEGVVEAVLSSELPIVPLAYAEVTSLEDNETHFVEVRDYGFSGAENLLPGEPAQTLPAMMFLQGMQQQMGGMGTKRMKKKGKKALKGKDVHHVDRNPKINNARNLKIQSKKKNRGNNK